MHIVVVTGDYYPYTIPPIGCFKPYLLELAKNNKVEVVCPSTSTHFTQSHIREGIRINYVNSIPNKILSYIRTNQEEHRYNKLTSFLFFLYRGLRYIKSLFCKEPYETSLIDAYLKKLQTINENDKIDVVVSVSFYFHCHVVALKFKYIHPQIRWITYTTDPLAYDEVNPIEKRKLKRAICLEKEVYSNCDYCITTEELYHNIVGDYNISTNKVLKLPYLMPTLEINNINVNRDKPIALYAGFLYVSIRNPKPLLELFSFIPDVNLLLHVTGDRHIRKMLLKEFPHNITVEGLVSREKYIKLLSEANILINLSNKIRLQAPSKLLELISTGKPVINFYYEEDSGYRMVDRYPLGLNILYSANMKEVSSMVKSFIMKNSNCKLTFEEIKQLFPENLLEVQMPKIIEVFHSNK